MAIINSLGIGKSMKSAGNLTYKTVRGRTIASQRITQNKSNTSAQSIQRSRFTQLTQSMQFLQTWINKAYEKSKYGSSRNAFAKKNPLFSMGGILSEIKSGSFAPGVGLLYSMSRPDAMSRYELNAFSQGSLSCIVNESTKVLPTMTESSIVFNNVLVCDSLSIDFTVPVPIADLEVYGVYFGAEKDLGTPSSYVVEKGTVSTDGRVTFNLLGTDLTCETVVVDGMVTNVKFSTEILVGIVQGLVSVKGKVPNIRSLFIGSTYGAG